MSTRNESHYCSRCSDTIRQYGSGEALTFQEEVSRLNKEIMLEPIELEIVSTLNEENKKMRAGEIAALIDSTHQLVGRRTSKLQDMGLVQKIRDENDGKTRSYLTERCAKTYFDVAD